MAIFAPNTPITAPNTRSIFSLKRPYARRDLSKEKMRATATVQTVSFRQIAARRKATANGVASDGKIPTKTAPKNIAIFGLASCVASQSLKAENADLGVALRLVSGSGSDAWRHIFRAIHKKNKPPASLNPHNTVGAIWNNKANPKTADTAQNKAPNPQPKEKKLPVCMPSVIPIRADIRMVGPGEAAARR